MDGKLILALETSAGCGSVAITRGDATFGKVLAEALAQPEITHSRRLLGSVEWAMQISGVDWSDLDGIAVSLGPGSFTGLRIGLAAAKGMAMAADLPLLGVETMQAMALPFVGLDKTLWCIVDARKQEVYAAPFSLFDALPRKLADTIAIKPQELVAKLASEPCFLLGSGVQEYKDIFSSAEKSIILAPSLSMSRAAAIGFLGAGNLDRADIMDQASAAPLYVRPSDAEFKASGK